MFYVIINTSFSGLFYIIQLYECEYKNKTGTKQKSNSISFHIMQFIMNLNYSVSLTQSRDTGYGEMYNILILLVVEYVLCE